MGVNKNIEYSYLKYFIFFFFLLNFNSEANSDTELR